MDKVILKEFACKRDVVDAYGKGSATNGMFSLSIWLSGYANPVVIYYNTVEERDAEHSIVAQAVDNITE